MLRSLGPFSWGVTSRTRSGLCLSRSGSAVQGERAVEPGSVILIVIAEIGEIGHGLLRFAHRRERMVKPAVFPSPVWRHGGQTRSRQDRPCLPAGRSDHPWGVLRHRPRNLGFKADSTVRAIADLASLSRS